MREEIQPVQPDQQQVAKEIQQDIRQHEETEQKENNIFSDLRLEVIENAGTDHFDVDFSERGNNIFSCLFTVRLREDQKFVQKTLRHHIPANKNYTKMHTVDGEVCHLCCSA